jgi:hypothetical protein
MHAKAPVQSLARTQRVVGWGWELPLDPPQAWAPTNAKMAASRRPADRREALP